MSSLVYGASKRVTVGLNPLDATLTKNTGEGAFPSRSGTHPSAPATVIRALSFHALTHCPFCNSSLFTHMHVMQGCTPLLAMRLATAIPASLSTIPYLLYFHTLSHSSALFCSRQNLNFFIFNLFRTLCQKHPGVGYVPLSPPPSTPLAHNGPLPVQPRFSTSHGSPVTSLPAVRVLSSPFCRRIAHSSRLGGRHE